MTSEEVLNRLSSRTRHILAAGSMQPDDGLMVVREILHCASHRQKSVVFTQSRFDQAYTVRRHTFEVIRALVTTRLSTSWIQNLKASLHHSPVLDSMVIELEASLAAGGPVVQRWPADWLEALKERFAPRWVLRRWPVVWSQVKLWERACPHLPIPGDDVSHVEFITSG